MTACTLCCDDYYMINQYIYDELILNHSNIVQIYETNKTNFKLISKATFYREERIFNHFGDYVMDAEPGLAYRIDTNEKMAPRYTDHMVEPKLKDYCKKSMIQL